MIDWWWKEKQYKLIISNEWQNFLPYSAKLQNHQFDSQKNLSLWLLNLGNAVFTIIFVTVLTIFLKIVGEAFEKINVSVFSVMEKLKIQMWTYISYITYKATLRTYISLDVLAK